MNNFLEPSEDEKTRPYAINHFPLGIPYYENSVDKHWERWRKIDHLLRELYMSYGILSPLNYWGDMEKSLLRAKKEVEKAIALHQKELERDQES